MKRGRTYTLNQWVARGGKRADINNKPSFSATGSVSGMRKLYYGYACDLVKHKGYYYKVN